MSFVQKQCIDAKLLKCNIIYGFFFHAGKEIGGQFNKPLPLPSFFGIKSKATVIPEFIIQPLLTTRRYRDIIILQSHLIAELSPCLWRHAGSGGGRMPSELHRTTFAAAKNKI